MDGDFSTLSPDLVLSLAERAGSTPTGTFLQLSSFENRVFSVDTEEGGIVLKIYRPGRWSAQALAEEHSFLSELLAAGVPVCAPVELGAAAAPGWGTATLGSAEGFFWAAWRKARGRVPDEFSDEMLVQAGRLLARLHGVGASRAFKHRPALDADSLIHGPLGLLKAKGSIPPGLLGRYEAAAALAAESLAAALPGMPVHRIHGDFHWGNLLWDGRELSCLDFDDCCPGPAVQDLWLIAPALDDYGRAQRARLLEGYRSVRPFDAAWLKAAAPLRAARTVDYAAWIAGRRDEPLFRATFPEFGTEEWWEQEVKDLEAILREEVVPDSESPAAAAIKREYEDVAKLTNKDYFFDM